MMRRLRLWIAERRQDQRGASLVEVVVALALFTAIGGSFVYASIVLEDARKTSLEETKSTISESGIVNSFRSDVSSAEALQLNGNSLSIAKSDGSCVLWTVQPRPDASESALIRAFDPDSAPSATSGSELTAGIGTGSLALSATKATLNLSFLSGNNLKESVNLNLAGSDGGECW